MEKGYLEYKGYTGSVEFSPADNCLFGKVLGIKSLISYEGQSVDELRNDFKDAIDDYLRVCEGNGTVPEKSFSGFSVKISPELHKAIVLEKDKEGLLDAIVKAVLEEAL